MGSILTAARRTARRRPPGLDFAPVDIEGLVGWYAADSLDLADGTAVSSWPDDSGQGNDASSAGSDPAYRTNQINGLPAVVFTTDALALPSGIVDVAVGDDAPYSVIAVWRPDEAAVLMVAWSTGSGIDGRSQVDVVNGDFRVYREPDSGTAKQVVGGAVTTGTWYLHSSVSGATSSIWVDGTQIVNGGDTDVPTCSPDSCRMMGVRLNNSENYQSAAMAELLIYDRKLTDAEQAEVESYLNDKYGIF